MDRHQLQGTSVGARSSQNIRRATHDDIPWMIDLAHSRYKGQWSFDTNQALLFLLQTLQSPQWLILRGDRSCGAVFWDKYIFRQETKRAHIYIVVAAPGKDLEPYHLVEHMVLWARKQGCLTIGADDETKYSLAPFLKRLGAKQGKHYTIELERIH